MEPNQRIGRKIVQRIGRHETGKKKQDIVVHPDGMLWGKEESQEKKGE